MIRTLPSPQNFIIGTFVFLAAVVCVLAPIPLLYRSLGVLIATYLAFSVAGTPLAYLTAIVAPLAGLVGNDLNWLVLLPILLTSLLLAVVGLEYAWRYPALIVSPLLYVIPQYLGMVLSKQELFAIQLPWEPASSWVGIHALAALASSLVVVYLDRFRERRAQRSSK
jgi:uncharacterized membrane protein